MIASHSLKLLFAHIPKTGGSAVTASLLPYINQDAHLPVGAHGWQPPLHEIGNMHSAWEQIKVRALPYIAEKGYRLAAAHRSPWERVASLYHKLGVGMTPEAFALDKDGKHAWWLQQAVDVAGPHVTNWLDYEHLERDVRQLLINCGVENPAPMVRTNVTQNKRPAREVLTPAAVEIIREKFVDDIEKFGYMAPREP